MPVDTYDFGTSGQKLQKARGPRKHLKRLNAPRHWMLSKMGGIWAPRPSSGPHKLRECLPLALILRNRLKYALTYHECKCICAKRDIKVDGRVRTDHTFPAGFMDTKGRFVLHRISAQEATYKLCRVNLRDTTKRTVPFISTHDSRTIRYPDPIIKTHDSVKINLATGEISEIFKFGIGSPAMITKGHSCGRIGTITEVQAHPGSFSIVLLQDAEGTVFSTRQSNVFVIGKAGGDLNTASAVSLPRGDHIKRSVIDEKMLVEKLKSTGKARRALRLKEAAEESKKQQKEQKKVAAGKGGKAAASRGAGEKKVAKEAKPKAVEKVAKAAGEEKKEAKVQAKKK